MPDDSQPAPELDSAALPSAGGSAESAAPETVVWDDFTLPPASDAQLQQEREHWTELETVARDVSQEFLAELPEDLGRIAGEVGIQIEVRPDRRRGFGPNLLGVFLGLKREDAQAGHSVIPPQICLFVENIWWQAGYNRDRFRDEVRLTLYHELGHYLGLDEDQLRRRGLG